MSIRQRAADAAARISPARAVSWLRGRSYASLDTPTLTWHRDHAVRNDLGNLRDHYDFILADRARAATGHPARIPRGVPARAGRSLR